MVRAGAFSLAIHAAALAALLSRLDPGTLAPDRVGPVVVALGAAQADDPWVDLVDPPELSADTPSPIFEPAADQRLPVADQTRTVANPTSPGRGTTEDPARPASDSGSGAGRRLPAAVRRDTSTLRARSSDGAAVYQISRERIAARASSPQSIRQESVVGIGDASRTRRPTDAEPAAPAPTLPTAVLSEVDPAPAVTVGEPVAVPHGGDKIRGQGPLDSEQGPRRFEIDEHGPARDTRSVRAASDEAHPGRLELAAVAATGEETSGHGPAATPGISSATDLGTATALRGATVPAPAGPEIALDAEERAYRRYHAEIKRRVERVLRFPKRLALMLYQGETVVQFTIRPDGYLAGSVKVVKSAGFGEFDDQAVSAVHRAAPFPPMRRPLTVSMPIAFENPVIR